jgi:protein SCO1
MYVLHRALLAAGVALLLAACPPSKSTFIGSDITGVDWGGDLSLRAHTGERVSLAGFRGKLVILFFGYSLCPDICSPTLAKLAALRKSLGADGERVQVVFITVDPAHDTVQQLAAFVPRFDPSFIGLTGEPAEIAAAARDYKIAYAPSAADPTKQIDHSSGIFVKDASGKIRLLWRNDISVEDMEHDVRLLLRK